MTTTYKLLGQELPDYYDKAKLYTVPTGKETVIRAININNSGTTDSQYSIAITDSNNSIHTTGFVAISEDSTYIVSTDALNWEATNYSSFNDNNSWSLNYTKAFDNVNGIYVYLPADPEQGGRSFNASTDGVNWKTYSLPWYDSWFKMVYRESSDSYFVYGTVGIVELQFDPTVIGTTFLNISNWQVNYDYAYPDTIQDWGGVSNADIIYSPTANLFVFINNYYDMFGYGVMTSTDGFTWQQTNIGADNIPGYWAPGSIELVHDYIVVASNAFVDYWVAYSKDGIIWTQMWWPYDGDFIDFKNIAFSNNKMVLQSDNQYYQSTDITPQTFSLFMAPSGGNAESGDPAGYLFSTDGINWENGYISDLDNGAYPTYNDYIVASNNKVVMFSSYSNNGYVTEDGTTWQKSFIDQNYALDIPSTTYNYDTGEMAMYYWDDDNAWYAFQTSTNGINWTTISTELNYLSDQPQGIAYGNNGDYAGYLGVNNDGGAQWSTDGITWEQIDTIDADEVYYTVVAIDYDQQSGVWIAHNGSNMIWQIANPYDWTNTYDTTDNGTIWSKIIIAPNQTWAILVDGPYMWQYDGDGGWYINYLPLDDMWTYSADYNPQNNTWAMTGGFITLYSTDGYTWSYSNVINEYTDHWGGPVSQGMSMSHATFTNKRPMWNFNDDESRSYTYNELGAPAVDLVYGNGIWLWQVDSGLDDNSYSTDLITWSYTTSEKWKLASFGNILYETIDDEDYIVSNATIKAGETITIKSGYTLGSNNSIVVISGESNQISYMAFGAEIG